MITKLLIILGIKKYVTVSEMVEFLSGDALSKYSVLLYKHCILLDTWESKLAFAKEECKRSPSSARRGVITRFRRKVVNLGQARDSAIEEVSKAVFRKLLMDKGQSPHSTVLKIGRRVATISILRKALREMYVP